MATPTPGFMRSVGFTALLEYDWYCTCESRIGEKVLTRLMDTWNERGRPSLADLVVEMADDLQRYAAELAAEAG